jgi:hypothetical protein
VRRLHSSAMAEATRPVSLRLTPRDIEQLKAGAYILSGTLTGVARDLILTGLAGGDNKALAERLIHIERRLKGLDAVARDAGDKAERIEAIARELRTKFDALLSALSSSEGAM